MVGFSKVIQLEGNNIPVETKGTLVIPCLWLYWQYMLNNITLNSSEYDLKDGRLTDVVIADLFDDFRLARVRNQDPFKTFPILMIYHINQKKWLAIMGDRFTHAYVVVSLNGQERCYMDGSAGYEQDFSDHGKLKCKYKGYDEMAWNKEVLTVFGNKMPLDMISWTPCLDNLSMAE